MRRVFGAVLALSLALSLLPGPPLSAWAGSVRSVRDFRAALALVKAYQAMSDPQRRQYRARHRLDLQDAVGVIDGAAGVDAAVIEANKQAMQRYGRPFLCNVDDDGSDWSTEELVDHYVEGMAARRGAVPGSREYEAILSVEVSMAVMVTLMDHHPCPQEVAGR